MNYTEAKTKDLSRKAKQARLYGSIIGEEKRIYGKAQLRFSTLAQSHAHESTFFASVSEQVSKGRPVSPKQAGAMMRIATEKGWKIPVV